MSYSTMTWRIRINKISNVSFKKEKEKKRDYSATNTHCVKFDIHYICVKGLCPKRLHRLQWNLSFNTTPKIKQNGHGNVKKRVSEKSGHKSIKRKGKILSQAFIGMEMWREGFQRKVVIRLLREQGRPLEKSGQKLGGSFIRDSTVTATPIFTQRRTPKWSHRLSKKTKKQKNTRKKWWWEDTFSFTSRGFMLACCGQLPWTTSVMSGL